jgi:hypothetical protein
MKSCLFVDLDMGTPVVVYKARYLKNLLSDLGFSEDKTPYSFKYVTINYLVNQNVSIESINKAARYSTCSKMVRGRYAINVQQMQIHKLLSEAGVPAVDILFSREEHLISFPKGIVSSISKATLPKSVLSKSKPLINLSTFTPKSHLENDS